MTPPLVKLKVPGTTKEASRVRYELSNPKLLIAGIALTLAAVASVEFLPARTLELTAPGLANGPYLNTSDGNQANAAVKWVNVKDKHLRCHYATAAANYLGCGLTYVLNGADPSLGRDLSGFDTMELDLAYKGPSAFVRVALRNFDPRFSKAEDNNSSRFHSINLRPRDIQRPVELELSELTVPEWWVGQYNLAREYNRPGFENVTALSIDLPVVQAGEEHELQLRRVTLKGHWVKRDKVYLGILCAWMFGALLMVLNGWAQLRRSHLRQQREIDALTARTRQLRVEQEKLRRLATIDELTGVLNRRGLEQSLEDFEDSARGMTLVTLDIDHFKHINDRHGHDCGDEVLRRVAAVVAANLRASDVFGRWGGEEFLIAGQGTRLREATRLAQKLCDRIEESEITVSGHRIAVTASFGVALAPPGGSTADALKRADEALYRAKEAGRNRVEMDKTLEGTPTTI
ncbi:GGDEF domain-containing protein [Roseateles sp. LYH14W]|uniref:diguanylate cyclase n=1 Tax=Pelomonas parva TaxID=3299032 RepID=A0ABW7FC59_9BURK